MSAAEQSISVKADEPFTFKWEGTHNVYRFPSEAAYKACDFSRATFVADKPFTMSLRGSGTVYFACKVGSHCKLGQKVAVTIGSGGGSGAPTGNGSCAGALSTARTHARTHACMHAYMVQSVFLLVLCLFLRAKPNARACGLALR